MSGKEGTSVPTAQEKDRNFPKGEVTVFPPEPISSHRIQELLSTPDDQFWAQVKKTWLAQRGNNPEDQELFDLMYRVSLKESWLPNRELIKDSQVIMMVEKGGLGDKVYVLLDACVIAQAYPDKTIVVHISGLKSLLPQSFFDKFPNLKCIGEMRDFSDYLPDQLEKVIYLEFGGINSAHSTLESAYEIETRFYEQADELEKELKETGTWIWSERKKKKKPLWSKFAPFIWKSLQGKSDQQIPELDRYKSVRPRVVIEKLSDVETGLVYALSHTLGGGEALNKHLQEVIDVQKDEFGNPVHRKKKKGDRSTNYFVSSPQILARTTRLRYLLGLENAATYLDNIPFFFAETEPKKYDLTVVYDSNSDPRKVLPEEQICQMIDEAKKHNPTARIGVVLGKDNPIIAQNVLARYPDIGLIEGDMPTVLSELLKSERVISVDTVWQHLINLAHHQKDLTNDQNFHPPELTVAVSTEAPFSPTYFMPDHGRVAVCTGLFSDCQGEKLLAQA